jgi:uncharacterized membrane protein YhaH (DUF805 family)
MNYYILAFKKYAIFSGRSRRSEYWYFILFNFLASFAIGFIGGLVGLGFEFTTQIYALVALIPGTTVLVRRLHDVGKSGWMILIILIPIIGFIWMILLLTRDSEVGDNKYGPNPKGINVIQS